MMLCCLFVLMYGCDKMLEDEPFSLKKTPNNSVALRLDGYYYENYSNDSYVHVLIFYRNGVMIDGGSAHSTVEFENWFRDNTFKSIIERQKTRWGLYVINDTIIKVETIVPTGWLHRFAYTKFGIILNDTTIHFYKNKESWSDVSEAIDDTFHFKVFSPKPDSINKYIP